MISDGTCIRFFSKIADEEEDVGPLPKKRLARDEGSLLGAPGSLDLFEDGDVEINIEEKKGPLRQAFEIV